MKTSSKTNLGRIAFTWAAGGVALASAIGGVAIVNAQAVASHNTQAPLSIDAGDIDIDDRSNRIVMTGGVIVKQGGLTVRSNRMLANYSDAGTLDVERITANGGVVVTRGNERASGDVAVYDFSRRIITMAGNVSIGRGGDTLEGGRLVIDLNTGRSSVDGRASGTGLSDSEGRVTGTFNVVQD